MSRIVRASRGFLRNEEGATMVEYALLVTLIAIVVIGAVTLLGSNTNNKLNDAAGNLAS
jgi:pilus assembly protein Flp/PilA